jgi:hypothetical protein
MLNKNYIRYLHYLFQTYTHFFRYYDDMSTFLSEKVLKAEIVLPLFISAKTEMKCYITLFWNALNRQVGEMEIGIFHTREQVLFALLLFHFYLHNGVINGCTLIYTIIYSLLSFYLTHKCIFITSAKIQLLNKYRTQIWKQSDPSEALSTTKLLEKCRLGLIESVH